MKKDNDFFKKNKKNDYNIKLDKDSNTKKVTKKKTSNTVKNDKKDLKVKLNVFSNKYSTIIFSLILVVIFVVVLSGSYAFFTTMVKGKEFVIYTGTLAVNYSKKTDVINVDNLYPMTNTEGLNQIPHEFTVTNDGNINARYQVRLEIDNSIKDLISPEYVKLSYSIDGSSYSEPVLLSNLNSNLVFLKDAKLAPTKSNTIGIKMWIDINAPNEIQGKTFKAKVVVDSIQDVDDGYVVDTAPIIYLNKDDNGNQNINLKVGETYTELGIRKIEDDQEILSKNNVIKTYEYYDGENLSTVDSVDTSKIGIYYITYSITDKSNNVGKAIRIVTINNTDTIPSITLKGESIITLEETEEYVEQGVTVDSGNRVVTIGEVKTNAVGTYILRYIVIDENGNLNSVIRTINVNKATTLYDKIFANNTLIEAEPTLTDSSNNTNDASGLYMSTATNSGDPTYYFRGAVENNYVEFAEFTWRIVRVNEDGTIRLIMQDGINGNIAYRFNINYSDNKYMYYSNSNVENGAKYILDNWYQMYILEEGYTNLVEIGDYYCEQAKVAFDSTYATNSGADMMLFSNYTNPNFKCETDKNGKSLVNDVVGLLTYDEVLHAGGYYNKANSDYFLYNDLTYWTMSPAGVHSNTSALASYIDSSGKIDHSGVTGSYRLRPVINLKLNTQAIGNGTSQQPYKVIY